MGPTVPPPARRCPSARIGLDSGRLDLGGEGAGDAQVRIDVDPFTGEIETPEVAAEIDLPDLVGGLLGGYPAPSRDADARAGG